MDQAYLSSMQVQIVYFNFRRIIFMIFASLLVLNTTLYLLSVLTTMNKHCKVQTKQCVLNIHYLPQNYARAAIAAQTVASICVQYWGYCLILQEICNKEVIKYPTSPYLCRKYDVTKLNAVLRLLGLLITAFTVTV